jgi:hypothetical protein
LVKVEGDEKHEFQAKSITGINGGKLMCENQRPKQSDKHSDKHSDNQNDRKSGNKKTKTA